MVEYMILAVIMAVLYFVLIKNRPADKSDWETLPTLPEYQKVKKTKNEQGELCCQYCGNTETVERPLNSEKENIHKTKFYHACTSCKVILWRIEKNRSA
ncbi:hypothetical protein [Psychromonas hadalis]|uniref:hypothetical protein n=1 Tax=Psychromonas hadalis TaxID=211669 RepID=UPI0003B63BEC|nr:hypothetical protein [Psychromonas hadalis]